jgi:membrane associated rhomboid family serine protease
MPPLPPVTQALMLLCTAFYCLDYLVPGLRMPLALWPVQSGAFMPWQVLTYAFLHGDAMHLVFNMLGLWMFGSELERLWGPRRYVQLLLAGALTAALAQLAFTFVIGSNNPTVGISGALFGLLLSYGMVFPNRIIVPLIPPIPMKARTFVLVFGVLELLQGVFGFEGVAHFAHLGGMLGAFVLLRFWSGKPPFGRR